MHHAVQPDSIACTAAASCCTVVMIGLSTEVVAERISYPSAGPPGRWAC